MATKFIVFTLNQSYFKCLL